MNILKNTLKVIAVAAVLDLTIVMGGLAQIALEGRTGEWAPFWRVQAEAIVSVLQ